MAHRTITKEEQQRNHENRFDLGALFEFSAIMNSSLDLTFILGHLLLTLMGKFLASGGVVLLKHDHHSYTVKNVKGFPVSLIGNIVEIKKVPRRFIYLENGHVRNSPWLSFFKKYEIQFLLPLIVRDKVVGLVGFRLSIFKKKLAPNEMAYIQSMTNIAAAAIEKGMIFADLKESNRQLDRKIHELNTLFELGKEFNATLDEERLVKLLMFSIIGQIGATRYFICIDNGNTMNVPVSKLDKPFNKELCTYFPKMTSPIIVRELHRKSDAQLQKMLSELGVQILIPLQIQHQLKGVVGLGEKMRGDEYTEADIGFLTSLGNLAVISLENARLFHETIEKQKLEDELLIAREIQRGLLPAKLPKVPGFDLAATNISSKQVGGDYYDVVPLSPTHYMLAIGDVSGKGTPASLLMANLQATIRALVPLGLSLSELTKQVNNLLCENTGRDRFITFFWGILDTKTQTMKYVSAGHNPPFLFHRNGTIERLDKGGIILGIMKTRVPYEEGEAKFSEGDTLVLFTDGVSEAMNVKGEEWGEEPLEEIAKQYLSQSPERLMAAIVDAVRLHSSNAPQSDDITLLVVKAIS
jgi:sigma-B regulation protein RsbU (phosphoserine phosphatase)